MKFDSFLEALEVESPQQWLSHMEKVNSRTDPFDLVELFQSVPSKLHELKLFRPLLAHLRRAHSIHERHVQQLPAEEGGQTPSGILDDDTDPEYPEEVAVNIFKGTILCSQAFISDKSRVATSSLRVCAHIIHDDLLTLPDAVQLLAIRFCETWWNQERPEREELIPQTITSLMAFTVLPMAKVVDLHRLYVMREAYRVLDFDDPSADCLKGLMLQAYMSPLYLRQRDGLKLLAFFFTLSEAFIDQIHLTIRGQLPTAARRRPLVEAYGEVYLGAWMIAEGATRLRIEHGCLQDLMRAAIHVRDSRLAVGLRRLLNVFHGRKAQKGPSSFHPRRPHSACTHTRTPTTTRSSRGCRIGQVDEMLYRLYEPILWRALSAANPHVRAGAGSLMVAAFPLMDPDGDRETTDATLQRHFDALLALLKDPVPSVRVLGVGGVCRVLREFWEMIPAPTIRSLLTRVGELGFDTSSAPVRVAVLQGLRDLLANPLAQPVLKELLPKLGMLLHDNTERVRAAFIDLLLAVRDIRSIRFDRVVPLDHVLYRLCAEGPVLATQLARLLAPSFLPAQGDMETLAQRCIHLVRRSPDAARMFFALGYRVTDRPTSSTLVRSLAAVVRRLVGPAPPKMAARAGRKPGDGRMVVADDDNDDDEEEAGAKETVTLDAADNVERIARDRAPDGGLPPKTKLLIAHLVEIMSIVAHGLITHSPADDDSVLALHDSFTHAATLGLLFDHLALYADETPAGPAGADRAKLKPKRREMPPRIIPFPMDPITGMEFHRLEFRRPPFVSTTRPPTRRPPAAPEATGGDDSLGQAARCARVTLLAVASLLPARVVEAAGLAGRGTAAMKLLRQLPLTAPETEWTAICACLGSWGHLPKVIDLCLKVLGTSGSPATATPTPAATPRRASARVKLQKQKPKRGARGIADDDEDEGEAEAEEQEADEEDGGPLPSALWALAVLDAVLVCRLPAAAGLSLHHHRGLWRARALSAPVCRIICITHSHLPPPPPRVLIPTLADQRTPSCRGVLFEPTSPDAPRAPRSKSPAAGRPPVPCLALTLANSLQNLVARPLTAAFATDAPHQPDSKRVPAFAVQGLETYGRVLLHASLMKTVRGGR
ncbi:putative Condensin-2 complex subunit G2 [Paratrimastix pyriformis]|uniref:Condensin-2 complex subunit G2 n=1 Tax=Paratrimastix pyriformis TaxID=342808 RepID=A0ABQ8UIQ1_9EUKA|nr:putative Condensin-2 complex subunit G2 [Paratrimastix pyriformis]